MNWPALVDPLSAALVLGGTLLAVLLRCGPGDIAALWRELAKTRRTRFDYTATRAALAPQVEAIRHDGILRAPPCTVADSEIAEATDALVHDRSLGALLATHQRYIKRRQQARDAALRVVGQAGDLAPVFGLAGTLFALSQMPAEGLSTGTGGGPDGVALMATVATAVLTTLYGLLAAHLLFYPLARMLERRGEREEAARQQLIDWLAEQTAPALTPHPASGAVPQPQADRAAALTPMGDAA
ncbi:hypothetical protein HME9302_00343 [Alteripontixanthobacter maritimus]|uniref:MotA/TolQ/ExbB proton channel domain-containing protein n=1 Tax=Alteripontixanthobacter maritimus TaxID=2161824 RepID=A0A369QA46_9SPHN|nr:MotA/TolQ/ExbB proton channel family protein [Alteripontixanthobacter maritimus]RDC59158.1 hypothetical protein HME9302_00343 [Alteripontixanthobacter maritimus]